MKTIFKKIPVLIVMVLACLLLVLYQASLYLSKQQEKARIQATIHEGDDSSLNNYYHPEADSIPEQGASTEATKFVETESTEQAMTPTQPTSVEENTSKAVPVSNPVSNPVTTPAKVVTTLKKPTPTTQVSKAAPKTTKASTPEKTTDGGDYFVIAGSFTNKLNAKAKLKEVKEKGFSNAKLVSFKSLKMVSVCLRTYPTEIQANAYAKQVKEKYDIATVVKRGSKKR